jgi:vacuolar-type H+-ATPase subunit F/Vma7
MGRVAVIGEETAVAGYALAGAEVFPTADANEVRDAWAALADDVVVVVLTARAAAALGPEPTAHPLRVVIPA